MPKTNHKKECRVATSPLKKLRKKNAADALIERFSKIIETGAQKMDAEQLRESEKTFNDSVDKANHKKGSRVTKSPLKQKTAMNSLLKSMDELAVAAAKRMTTGEVREVRKQINDLVDRAVERKPRRETA
jgi:ribonuclease HI